MKKQAGFTLIELVMVIVILGILAAVALPKFVNLGADARTAAMKGVEGSMRSANAMIYAKAAVGNKMQGASATEYITVPGGVGTVYVAYGYARDATELAKVMDLSTDFTVVGSATNYGSVSHSGAQNPAACIVTYTAATAANIAPTYVLTPGGC